MNRSRVSHLTSSQKRRIEDDDEEPSTSSGYRRSKEPRFSSQDSFTQSISAEVDRLAGRIEKIQMTNFMCHANLELKFNPRVTFVTGRNGSGKSAVMAALIVVLGGRAHATGRASGVADFIKKGESNGKVSITLINEGLNPYKKDLYGKRITIVRTFSRTSSNTYTCKSESGQVISKKKEEVDKIVTALNLQIENPICILNQDVARTFLGATDGYVRFTMFMKATQLEELETTYKAILNILWQTQKELERKEETTEEASKEVRELKRKMEHFQALEKDAKEKEHLECELLWSMVRLEEKKIEEWNLKNEKLREEKEEMTASAESYNEKIQSLKDKVKEIQEKLESHLGVKNERGLVKNELRKDYDNIQKQINTADTEIRHLRNKIDRQLSDIRGIKEHLDQGDANASQSQIEKESNAQKMREIKEKLSEISARMTGFQRDLDNSVNTLDQKNVDVESSVADLRNLEHRKRNIEVQINSANSRQSGQGNLAKFGNYVPKLLEAIEEAYKKRQFKHKPIGPCGRFITLNCDKKYARAVEGTIGGLMTTFCCDNQEDFNTLSKIMDRVCGPRQPNIIISKFRSRHNVSSKKISSGRGYNPLIDALNVENDVVFNTLVDQVSVETVALFDSDDHAQNLLSHVQNVPRNLRLGVTIGGDQYFPAPNYRSYMGDDRPLRFFDEAPKSKESIRNLEVELQNIDQLIVEKNSEINNMRQEIHRLREMSQRADGNLKELRQRKRKLEADYSELKDIEESRPMLQTRVALEEELRTLQGNYDATTEKLSKCSEDLSGLKAKKKEIMEKLKGASDEEKALNEEVQSLQEKLDDAKYNCQRHIKKKDGAGNRVEEINKKLDDVDRELKKCQNLLEERIKTATEICPERIDTERSPTEVQKALQKCNSKLKAAEKLHGSKEDTIEEYKNKYGAFKKIKRILKKMDEKIKFLAEATAYKEQRFKVMKQNTACRVSLEFQATLQTRGYDGSLKIDFNEKCLDIEVQPKDDTEVRKDAKTLSGGERSYSTVSFILAIWKTVHIPFYFLDEFDVFMDKINRKIIMDLLLDHAQNCNSMQYVFITPQDISSIKTSDVISIYKMPDPERRHF